MKQECLKELDNCSRCGKCRSVCPVFGEVLDERLVARGRLALLEAYLKGDIEDSEKLRNALDECLMCLRCEENCPSGVNVRKLLAFGREKSGKSPLNFIVSKLIFRFGLQFRTFYDIAVWLMASAQALLKHLEIVPSSMQRHLPLYLFQLRRVPDMPRKSALKLLPGRQIYKDAKMKVAVFTGCLGNYVYPDVIKSLCGVLDSLHISYIIPKEQLCCGVPAFFYGDPKSAFYLARKNVTALKMDDVDAVLSPCASCARMLKTGYKELFNRFAGDEKFAHRPEKVMDIIEFLDRYIDLDVLLTEYIEEDGEIEPDRMRRLRIDKKVTYHKPCHLSWDGADEANRRILRQMADYVESPEGNLCCGGGGLFSAKYEDLSSKIAVKKIKSIERSGAEIVATPCPGCMMQIRENMKTAGLPGKVLHPVELLNELLKAKAKNRG
ncbi:MAG: (Fe-S)-binding protein [Planctomycetes bacterium]|nr:(Fe-S)-binding protein [Planctomycetota bacterium]